MIRQHPQHFLDRRPGRLPQLIQGHSRVFENEQDFDPLLERIGDARLVMLGEATHGTSEFYTWRARLTKRLIAEKGFSFVAVEGDWPDCYRVNRFVKGYRASGERAYDVVRGFERWPTWMWANWEIVALIDWMRRFNENRGQSQRIGFYGLDVYSLNESLALVLQDLERRDSAHLEAARRAFQCFEPHGLRGQDYARATALVGANCRDEVVELLTAIREAKPSYHDDFEEELNLRQNARVLVNAEHYYRTMLSGGPRAWNTRDKHMTRTLDDLLSFYGPNARGIVWEHNTHIGDARATDMNASGMVNVGQLSRRRYGDDQVVLVGFGTQRGSVIAASHWGAPMERVLLPPAMVGSWEDIFHRMDQRDRLVIMDDIKHLTPAFEPRGHRAVGVIYGGPPERRHQYVPTILPRRYDAFVHLEKSRALHPLHIAPRPMLEPETFPWGV